MFNLVGDFDYDTGKFFYTISGEIDWGFDYYAPQSFLAPDGRRILVGWAMLGLDAFGKTGVRHIKKAGADSLTFRERRY